MPVADDSSKFTAPIDMQLLWAAQRESVEVSPISLSWRSLKAKTAVIDRLFRNRRTRSLIAQAASANAVAVSASSVKSVI